MLPEEILQGMRVRYPRTGTTGKVVRVEQIRGVVFAELDSTNLLYRIDQLVPAAGPVKKVSTVTEEAKKVIERERAFAGGTEFQEILKNIDQSCEGGG